MRHKTPSSLVPSKVKLRKRLAFFKKAAWMIIALLILFQLFQTNRLLKEANQGTSDRAVAQIDILKESLNEVRSFLSLPTHETVEEEAPETLETALYGILAQQKNEAEVAAAKAEIQAVLNTYVSSAAFVNLIEGETITLSNPGEDAYELVKDEVTFFSFGRDSKGIFLRTPSKETRVEPADFVETINQIVSKDGLSRLRAEKLKMDEKIQLLNSVNRDLASILAKKNLKIVVSTDPLRGRILMVDDSAAGAINYDLESDSFTLANLNGLAIERELGDAAELKEAITKFVENNNFFTFLEQEVAQKIEELEDLINQDSFQSALSQSGLTTPGISEAGGFYILEFKNKDTVVVKISINKVSGEVIVEQDGQKTILDQTATPISSKLEKGEGINFLITGKHGALTDTIILANVNEHAEKVTLISFPRDLYVEDQKINSTYYYKGMNSLIDQVESLSGLPIENYALIDMYAFIDVVDYLGGIDVTLEQDLIDPSYKTLDNGRWGTLFYPAGTHHLSGKQALRIARSRHFSSDFARAKRQHKILSAIKDKVQNISIFGVNKLFQISYTTLNKTETDLATRDALKYFLKYKDYEINSEYVLSTGNVLTSGYTGGPDCEEECGAYILKPKDDDWQLIRSFVHNAIAS